MTKMQASEIEQLDNKSFNRWCEVSLPKVHTRNPHDPKRELSFLEKIISCVKMSKKFNEIDFNLT